MTKYIGPDGIEYTAEQIKDMTNGKIYSIPQPDGTTKYIGETGTEYSPEQVRSIVHYKQTDSEKITNFIVYNYKQNTIGFVLLTFILLLMSIYTYNKIRNISRREGLINWIKKMFLSTRKYLKWLVIALMAFYLYLIFDMDLLKSKALLRAIYRVLMFIEDAFIVGGIYLVYNWYEKSKERKD